MSESSSLSSSYFVDSEVVVSGQKQDENPKKRKVNQEEENTKESNFKQMKTEYSKFYDQVIGNVVASNRAIQDLTDKIITPCQVKVKEAQENLEKAEAVFQSQAGCWKNQKEQARDQLHFLELVDAALMLFDCPFQDEVTQSKLIKDQSEEEDSEEEEEKSEESNEEEKTTSPGLMALKRCPSPAFISVLTKLGYVVKSTFMQLPSRSTEPMGCEDEYEGNWEACDDKVTFTHPLTKEELPFPLLQLRPNSTWDIYWECDVKKSLHNNESPSNLNEKIWKIFPLVKTQNKYEFIVLDDNWNPDDYADCSDNKLSSIDHIDHKTRIAEQTFITKIEAIWFPASLKNNGNREDILSQLLQFVQGKNTSQLH